MTRKSGENISKKVDGCPKCRLSETRHCLEKNLEVAFRDSVCVLVRRWEVGFWTVSLSMTQAETTFPS